MPDYHYIIHKHSVCASVCARVEQRTATTLIRRRRLFFVSFIVIVVVVVVDGCCVNICWLMICEPKVYSVVLTQFSTRSVRLVNRCTELKSVIILSNISSWIKYTNNNDRQIYLILKRASKLREKSVNFTSLSRS